MLSQISESVCQQAPSDVSAKVVIVGDSGVGKTNLLLRFTNHLHEATHVSTVGVDFMMKTLNINHTKIKMEMWDTAGQQRFRTITEAYYKGTSGVLLVFSVINRRSFLSLQDWLKQARQHSVQNTPCIVVGNKIDSSERQILQEEARELTRKYGAVYMQTSAKQNINVEQVFAQLALMILRGNVHKKKNMKTLLRSKLDSKPRGRCC